MPHYQASCHCGAVRFSFATEQPVDKGIRCNCSICARKGALMSLQVFAPEELAIQAEDEALALYQFGDGRAKHFFCRHCGIYPFHETLRAPGKYRVNPATGSLMYYPHVRGSTDDDTVVVTEE